MKYILTFVRQQWLRLLILFSLLWLLQQREVVIELNLTLPAATAHQRRAIKDSPPIAAPTVSSPQQATISPFEGSINTPTITTERAKAFIERFGQVATMEQKKFGIPASIILANGLWHSEAGTSALVTKGNNYFALPCDDDQATSDAIWHGGKRFRHYDNAWLSFRDHSLYLAHLAAGRNITDWAAFLEKEVYHQPGLGEKLHELIQQWKLHQWDHQ